MTPAWCLGCDPSTGLGGARCSRRGVGRDLIAPLCVIYEGWVSVKAWSAPVGLQALVARTAASAGASHPPLSRRETAITTMARAPAKSRFVTIVRGP
jgi:hypothetical protein